MLTAFGVYLLIIDGDRHEHVSLPGSWYSAIVPL